MFKEILVLLGMVGTLLAYGTTWDETRYAHDHATGLLKKKIYADGHEINYTHTHGDIRNVSPMPAASGWSGSRMIGSSPSRTSIPP